MESEVSSCLNYVILITGRGDHLFPFFDHSLGFLFLQQPVLQLEVPLSHPPPSPTLPLSESLPSLGSSAPSQELATQDCTYRVLKLWPLDLPYDFSSSFLRLTSGGGLRVTLGAFLIKPGLLFRLDLAYCVGRGIYYWGSKNTY